MKKKCLSIAAVFCATALLFTSCGKSKDASSAASNNTSSKSTVSDSTSSKSENSSAEVTKEPEKDGPADILDYVKDAPMTPPCWKVTDETTGNTIYMLGTIHVLPDNGKTLPDELMKIYDGCDSIAVEYDTTQIETDLVQMTLFQSMFVYTDGTKITDHISQETYERAKAYLKKKGLYVNAYDQYCAGYWVNLIETGSMLSLENLSAVGVDKLFIGKATEDQKEIIDIETLDDQAGVLISYEDAYADFSLDAMLDELDEKGDACVAESLAALYNEWASGSDELLDLEEEDLSGVPEDILKEAEKYQSVAIGDRNDHMVERAEEFIKEGKNVLFMVGTGHYSGENGVDDQLKAKGYKVERVDFKDAA